MKSVMLFVGVSLTIIPMWCAFHSDKVVDAAILGYMAGLYGVMSIRICGEAE